MRYITVLTGLGFDEERQQPFFGEHDVLLEIDFELTEEDLEEINQLRYCMSHLLLAEPTKQYPDLVDGDKVKLKSFFRVL